MMEILPDRCTTIAKKELIYAGTVGLICWLGGIVFINRKKTSDAKNVMCDAAKTMLEDQVDELKLKVFQRMVICAMTFFVSFSCTDSTVGVPRGDAQPARGPAALQKRCFPPGSAGAS